jgi:hypothetical protein
LLPNFNKLVFFIDPLSFGEAPPSSGEGFAQGSLGELLARDSRGEVPPSFGKALGEGASARTQTACAAT